MDAKCTQPPSSALKLRRTTSADGSGTGTIILGKYQLGRLLGRGSFAKVYHGRCLNNNSNIAIKVIDKTSISDPSMEPRIIREVSVMTRVNDHPNIIQLDEVLATKTKIYLIMEIATGGDLYAKLNRRGRFSDSTARFYFHQLVSALHFCHQNGVTHRDIKLQNLLLDQNNNLKISDFGLSALPEQLNNGLLHTACGTPAYTAPEVAYRKGYDGAKADSWSCGVILFAFLSGFLPFDDSNISNMYRAIHRRVFKFPDWVSKPARNIIKRLLDPNPSTRLSIEELMNLSWFKKSGLKQGESNRQQKFDECMYEKECKNLGRVNAFDIISMSSGLDLSGLFEVGMSNKKMRFTTRAKIGEVEEKLMKIGKERGYKVERGKGGGIELVKGRVVLMVEIWEVAMELLLVEIKVVNGGLEFEDFQWEELKVRLQDIVVSWYTNGSVAADAGGGVVH
ncbi:CBL-interacting serine/threonine-protein kinase 7-like [Nicotiana tabacum]|uniref:non-specific serine/threonine protein kinase n=2 Tax=Nicotiana TaxID=4085 RepID=A0A1S4B1F7_TOBAC|nr:PREDICTED: CBL-interacting serine/threonine-protein kinase 7-like [Nicotiana sylvestris]XP_016482770.1 PREDICTED: CBL-interacting serine/threonine-protein kinase 7-like [Nicotiana tabacum]